MMNRETEFGLVVAAATLAVSALAFVWLRSRRELGGHASAAPSTSADGPHAADDVEALARVITSEADRYSLAERRAIAWTVRNRARKRRKTITELVCTPTCGSQGPGRPFSSARPATSANLILAREVLAAPQSDDPTVGALAYFEPAVQDRLVAQGRPGYRFDSSALRRRWEGQGQQQLATVGAFEFWA